MNKIELDFGKWDRAQGLLDDIAQEVGLENGISLDDLEAYIRSNGDFFVEMRHADEPYGEAGVCLQELLLRFDHLKAELGAEHFDYTLLPRELVILDFTKCRYIGEIYLEMREKMEWDDWYGDNLDALWDILTGLSYKGDDFIIRRPRVYTDIPYGKNEGFGEYMDKVHGIFRDAQQEVNITVRLEYSEEAASNDDFMI